MLTELFKTKERVRIISYIIYQKNCTVNQISHETGVTKGLVSRYFRYVYGTGLLTREGQSYHPKDCVNTGAIKLLLNLNKINIESMDADWREAGEFIRAFKSEGSAEIMWEYMRV